MQRAVFDPFAAVCREAAASSSSGWRSAWVAFSGAETAPAPTSCSGVLHRVQLSSPMSKLGASSSTAADAASHPSVLLSWHPTGCRLAVAVSASGGAWVLLFASGMLLVQECCWSNLADERATGLLHAGACRICSLAWVSRSSDALAVIDSHGRLCMVAAAAGVLERLQLMDVVSPAARAAAFA
ncbi:hypothetical protein OEZ85_008592 [Tetradesmus obliquus]|uniref:Anaphase-promoting complex subunit 4 WD40 domain-containing protein n=1 Tax=Tetradesmus obliquus TaxID=3088 RepID=A0ABY8TMZ2_TETOB|nr:hypothetical protein OEZ85_008592 [Tetradesmus obliquus]